MVKLFDCLMVDRESGNLLANCTLSFLKITIKQSNNQNSLNTFLRKVHPKTLEWAANISQRDPGNILSALSNPAALEISNINHKD